MLPDQAHVRSEDWTIFFLHKNPSARTDEHQFRAAESEWTEEMDEPPLMYVLNLVNTKHDKELKR